ncbi:MAG TPA: pyridoxamine 5'-phosphate oxidase [Solirubrobacteraceae bacterium]|nr:pyridoxamine 5'-phosphate oxidase [Solirubrobacteraceae bacterium]
MPDASPALTRDALADDPIEQFVRWLAEAEATGMTDPNAMTVATAGADGRPSARTILLRGAGHDGFRFYTNRESLKGRQLAENPRAQLLFYWRELGRQILVHGSVEPTSDADSDAYFQSRPRISRLGAHASRQGQPISGREELLDAVAAADARYPGEGVPRPEHWGGFRLTPDAIEFWQAGEFRLHDRFVYVREDETGKHWRIERLSP